MQITQIKSIRFQWLWVVPILLLAFALVIPHMETYALWFDEAYTHLYTGTGRLSGLDYSIWQTTVNIAKNNPSWPPLYFVAQNIWAQFAGHTLFSEHMLPLLAGILGIAVIYRFGKSLLGEIGGLWAALLFSTSAFYIHFMHETRAYTLYTLFVALIGWLYWLLVKQANIQSKWLRWGFPIIIALALYTHYVAGAFVIGIGAYHIIIEMPSRSKSPYMSSERWWLIARLWLNGCLLFSPWLAVLIVHLTVESGNERSLPFVDLMQHAIYGFSNNLWLIVVPILLTSVFFWKKREVRFLWIWTIFAVIVIAFVNAYASFLFHPRHILALLMVFVFLFVSTLLEISKRIRFISPLIIVAWLSFGIFYSLSIDFMAAIPNHTIPQRLVTIETMQSTIDACIQDDDAVIFGIQPQDASSSFDVVIQYYFFDRLDEFFQLLRLLSAYNTLAENSDEINTQDWLTDYLGDFDTIWLMVDPSLELDEPLAQFRNLVDGIGYQACVYTMNDTNIWFYTKIGDCEIIQTSC